MGTTRKEKLETCTDTPLQIITKNALEESPTTEDYIKIPIKKRKQEANQPLYFKRV
jgi:hypothetical protein